MSDEKLKLSGPIIVPVRPFDPTSLPAPSLLLDQLNDPGSDEPVIRYMIDGLQTRDVQGTEPRVVTQADIDAAIVIAQVEGTAPLCGYEPEHFRCVTPPHCKSCDCKGTGWSSPKCEHDSAWECICAAIGGSGLAADLYLAACSEVYHWLHNEHDDCDESCGDTLSFVDPAASFVDLSSVDPAARGTELFDSDLEVAALLADGWLPAGWST